MRTVIHFIHNVGGDWRVACKDGDRTKFTPALGMRSDDPRAVNCQKCMQSNIFADRIASIRAMEASQK